MLICQSSVTGDKLEPMAALPLSFVNMNAPLRNRACCGFNLQAAIPGDVHFLELEGLAVKTGLNFDVSGYGRSEKNYPS